MYHFFVHQNQIIGDNIHIEGSDVNHIMNVLRLNEKQSIILSDQSGIDYVCKIESLTDEVIHCKILTKGKSKSELPNHISLVQGAPKQDKMELIIQKSVELGVYEIIPVEMKRSIVKFNDKKVDKKVERWQSIAEAAAKQSKRGIIPKVNGIESWKKTLEKLSTFDRIIIPYEHAEGMARTREVFSQIKPGETVAIVIGPEGGFEASEIADLTGIGGNTISLGNRILRTETAGISTLSMLVYQIEEV